MKTMNLAFGLLKNKQTNQKKDKESSESNLPFIL